MRDSLLLCGIHYCFAAFTIALRHSLLICMSVIMNKSHIHIIISAYRHCFDLVSGGSDNPEVRLTLATWSKLAPETQSYTIVSITI